MSTNLAIEFLDLDELASSLKVKPKTIHNLMYDKRKKKKGISDEFYLKVGKKILFVKYKVEEAILSGTLIS